jgi:hypothetical protein
MANRRFIDFPIAASVGNNDIVLIWQDGLNKQTTKATLLQGSPQSLAGLTDVDIAGLINGQILQYNSTTSKWENVDRTDIFLSQLGDVTIVAPANGQVLVYNSSTGKWENSSGGYVPYTGAVTTVNLGAQSILAGSFVKAGGTAAQFLKANGSVDSTAYGTGTVTSVALTMPTAFSVAGSPITTAGTLAVTATGTTSQYIRGDGSLATFPALTGFVPYTGATADVNLGTHDLAAERGTFANNGSSDTLTVNHTSGSGYGIIVTKGGANEALYVSKTSGSGNAMTVVGGRTSLVDLALSSVTNTAGDFLTLSGGVVHKRTAAEVRTDIGAGTVTSVAALTLSTSGTDLSSTVANGTTTPVITLNVPTASASNRGALSSADWSTFNSKQAQLNGTGFVKASGTTISYDNSTYQVTSEKAQPNGYASLDGNGKVPLAQINDALIGNVNFQGLWNAATNTPTLANPPASGTKGYYYIVSTAGTFASISFEVGDWIISDGTAWGKVDNTDAVSSVFGRTGNVTSANGDYTTAQVTESGNLYYTDGRARGALSFVAGSGAYNSTTGVITIPTNNNQITNGAGYITSAALSGYLPLTGGTLTGPLGGTSISLSGDITANRYRGVNSLVLNSYTTVNPSSNVYLYSPLNDRDAWVYLDSADTGNNWGIYHRQIDSAVSGLPANSIGFIGGGSSTLQAWISLATGNGFFAGDLTANNLSGTNTGNVTIATANGLSISGQALSLGLASGSANGALSSTDWTTFNNKQAAGNYVTTDTTQTITGQKTISRNATSFNGTVQSFLIDGQSTVSSGNEAALTLNSGTAGFAYQTFAQGGVGKFEMGIVGTSGNGSFYINRNIQFAQTGASIFIKKADGFVGINNIDPSFQLDVSGVFRSVMPSDPLTGTVTAKILSFSPAPFGLVFRGYETGVHSIQSQREANDGQLFGLSLQPNGGNVLIGTTTDSGYKFTIANTTQTFGTSMSGGGVDFFSSGNFAPHYQTNYTWYTGAFGSGTERMQLTSIGNLILNSGSSSGGNATSTPKNIRFNNDYSSGYTDASLKIFLFNSGSTIQGFTSGPEFDLQYHSSGSTSGKHVFYVANNHVMTVNNLNVLVGTQADSGDKLRVAGTTFSNEIMTLLPESESRSNINWRFGAASIASITPNRRLRVKVGGVEYYIGAVEV